MIENSKISRLIFLIYFTTGCGWGHWLYDKNTYEKRLEELTDNDGDGFSDLDGDCDDLDIYRYPGADEVCNEKDDDCDSYVDEEIGTVWFFDADEDGYGAEQAGIDCDVIQGTSIKNGDCDDYDETVNPSAEEVWYDGIDGNCSGNLSDFDADLDGYDSVDYGGEDCDDMNSHVYPDAQEGWVDIGIDNDCDFSIDDQVVANLRLLATRIDGPETNAALGGQLLVIPEGWLEDDMVLLSSAPLYKDSAGALFGWTREDLGGPTMEIETNLIQEGVSGDLLGFGLAWAGSPDVPLVIVSREGSQNNRGEVHIWRSPSLASMVSPPDIQISGSEAGQFCGYKILSETDVDGDGSFDLVISCILESGRAPNAGSVAIFTSPESTLLSDVSIDDADFRIYGSLSGGQLSPEQTKDFDNDGYDDIGFRNQGNDNDDESGGYLLSSKSLRSGDIESIATAQFVWGGTILSESVDLNFNGIPELFISSGGVVWMEGPFEGSIAPYLNKGPFMGFKNEESWLSLIRSDVPAWGGERRFLTAATSESSERGIVVIPHALYGDGEYLYDSKLIIEGEQAGDQLGASVELMDINGDGEQDLLLGAPGVDYRASGAGAIYILPAPM